MNRKPMYFVFLIGIAVWFGWLNTVDTDRAHQHATAYAQSGNNPWKKLSGALAVQAIGRIVVGADGTADIFGYFTYVEGIEGSLFSGTPSESTAYLTFRSERTSVQVVPNGSIYHLLAQPLTGTFTPVHVYYQSNPSHDFNVPESLSQGETIATYRTRGLRATVVPPSTFTLAGAMELESAVRFTFGGRTYNVGRPGDGIFLTAAGPGLSIESLIEQLTSSGRVTIPFGGHATFSGSYRRGTSQ